jgi:lipoyl(octanoyl) transferase
MSMASAASAPELWVCSLGTIEYREALALQKRVQTARQAGAIPDVMLLLEHWPVYTRGRRSAPGELPMGEDWYRMQGIDVVATNRGGKVTYHGPGQLVGYPMMAIDDVVGYVRTLERGLVAALHDEGVSAARARPQDGPDYTGVWVGERKIASIGVHVARGRSRARSRCRHRGRVRSLVSLPYAWSPSTGARRIFQPAALAISSAPSVGLV